jgi:hypothetical protein
LYLGDTKVASDPEWNGAVAKFKDLTMSVGKTKEDLVIKVVTKPYTANSVTAVNGAYVDKIEVTKAN